MIRVDAILAEIIDCNQLSYKEFHDLQIIFILIFISKILPAIIMPWCGKSQTKRYSSSLITLHVQINYKLCVMKIIWYHLLFQIRKHKQTKRRLTLRRVLWHAPPDINTVRLCPMSAIKPYGMVAPRRISECRQFHIQAAVVGSVAHLNMHHRRNTRQIGHYSWEQDNG